MNEFINDFTFIRPLFLFALLPMLILYIVKIKLGHHQNVWQQILPQHLYSKLVVSRGAGKPSRFIHMATFAATVAIISIAGPTWEKLPQAVYQTQNGKVLLMDMSMSMRATDISPNRLTRARFKAIDLINQVNEGETGLIAYSGDAFVVSPLTDDANTLISLIPSLTPEIMPSQGSSAMHGLERSAQLLLNAGYQSGHIYWITDGIIYDDVKDIRQFIQNSPFKVSALLVGTEEGAPITLQDGSLLKDNRGRIVIPSVNTRFMNQAMAGTSAAFQTFTNDNSDIMALKRMLDFEQQQQAEEVENVAGDEYKDMGPFLVLLVLPFVAYAFRRGVLVFALCAFLMLPSDPSMAKTTQVAPQSETVKKVASWFKNADQKGKQAFDNEDYVNAQNLFENKEWQAASAYKQGEYEQAVELYSQLNGLENTYNLGNALAKTGKLEEALEAYNEVLSDNPKHTEAQNNKKIVEELLEQMKENQQQEQNQDQNQNQDQENSQQDQQEQSNSNQDQEGSEGESDDQQGQPQSGEQDQKNGENQNDQQQSDESLKDQAQNQQQDPSAEENNQTNSDGNEQANDEATPEEAMPEEALTEEEMQQAISNQVNMDELTPEQREEMQRMQMILNKVPDDPAYLLKRKMLLESYKRKTSPPPTQENW